MLKYVGLFLFKDKDEVLQVFSNLISPCDLFMLKLTAAVILLLAHTVMSLHQQEMLRKY